MADSIYSAVKLRRLLQPNVISDTTTTVGRMLLVFRANNSKLCCAACTNENDLMECPGGCHTFFCNEKCWKVLENRQFHHLICKPRKVMWAHITFEDDNNDKANLPSIDAWKIMKFHPFCSAHNCWTLDKLTVQCGRCENSFYCSQYHLEVHQYEHFNGCFNNQINHMRMAIQIAQKHKVQVNVEYTEFLETLGQHYYVPPIVSNQITYPKPPLYTSLTKSGSKSLSTMQQQEPFKEMDDIPIYINTEFQNLPLSQQHHQYYRFFSTIDTNDSLEDFSQSYSILFWPKNAVQVRILKYPTESICCFNDFPEEKWFTISFAQQILVQQGTKNCLVCLEILQTMLLKATGIHWNKAHDNISIFITQHGQ